jgi:hypothetical protein
MTDEQRYRPFYCGSQSVDWEGANCHRCVKGLTAEQDAAGTWPICEIQAAITYAAVGDGSFDETMARRIGWFDHRDRYCWPCSEVEWTEEWKAEYRRKHAEEAAPHD